MDWKWNGMRKGNGNGKGNGIVKQTTGGDDISCASVFQLQKQLSEDAIDREGKRERIYSEPEASPVGSISSHHNTYSMNSDGKDASECDSDVDLGMEDDEDAPDSIDLDGDVDMEWDGQDQEVEMVDNKEQEEEKEEEVVDKYEAEDEYEDNGKDPLTIAQGEMVNTSNDETNTMIDDEQTV
jgi:hypothetical protein